ncbi:unnamed protein product [Phytophthora lilii]|uniref:Unnamed protein product n=1 Tax=Phytophthora lilii TaxID=2077276 RepID=A0A9W6U296_9STRA|nr:unnamed protein product [Phytophthora lilii]
MDGGEIRNNIPPKSQQRSQPTLSLKHVELQNTRVASRQISGRLTASPFAKPTSTSALVAGSESSIWYRHRSSTFSATACSPSSTFIHSPVSSTLCSPSTVPTHLDAAAFGKVMQQRRRHHLSQKSPSVPAQKKTLHIVSPRNAPALTTLPHPEPMS